MLFGVRSCQFVVNQEGLYMNVEEKAAEFRKAFDGLRAEVGKVIVGAEGIVDGVLSGCFPAGMCWSKACRGWARRCSCAP